MGFRDPDSSGLTKPASRAGAPIGAMRPENLASVVIDLSQSSFANRDACENGWRLTKFIKAADAFALLGGMGWL